MGSIRPRGKNGLLVIDFRYQGMRCREQTMLEDSPNNRKRLEKQLAKIEREIAADSFQYAKYFPHSPRGKQFCKQPSSSHTGTPLFRDFAKVWFDENQVLWKNSVSKGYALVLKTFLIPHFGHFEVGAITKADILQYRAKLMKEDKRGGGKRAPSTINNLFKPLRGILIEAADRYDFPNQFMHIKKIRERKKDIHPFSLDEVMLICRNIRQDYQNYMIVRFFTGMRSGEIDGLKWKYVDFENDVIRIRETVVMFQEETPKTESSYRDISMLPLVKDALINQKKYTIDRSKYVFCNTIGTPIYHNNFRRRIWIPLLKRLGLERRRPYETRHTAATLWLASGENPEWVARQLGHTNTEMLFRVYSRFIPNLTRQDGSAFEHFIKNKLAEDTNEK